ncbi:hypothetical protein ABUJ42_19015 [Salmonella enterica subsp. enterica serovar Chester]|uniref:hypothetical protein n=1 Tax=Salmonella enterica TaxID=28901 RepID=UPI003316138C
MAKASLVQTNFTAGELSPRLMGRVDIERYANGAEIIENAVCLIHGGALRAPGTRFLATAKYADKACRLIPYVFNRQQAYILEFGDKYIRFYYQTGKPILVNGRLYEISTPFSASILFDLTYVQGADTMFIAHQSVPMQRLQRWGDTDWRIENVPWVVAPYTDEARDQIDADCKPQDGAEELLVGDTVELTLSNLNGSGFASTDVGNYIEINDGLVLITEVVDADTAKGTIETALTSDVKSPSGAWTISSGAWNSSRGYPAAVTLSEQRLVAAGTPTQPQTFWMSRTGEYLNFQMGTEDDDAMSFTINSSQLNPIVHVEHVNSLLALTYGGEFTITGSSEKPVTPTNINVRNPGAYGCSGVKPVRIGGELVFIQRSGRKARALSFDPIAYEKFTAPDVSVLAEHITESGIKDISYQQEPNSLTWAVRTDGVMAVLTLDREQSVTAWTRRTTQGQYESVACIPSGDKDVLFVVVKRTINGKTLRYIERVEWDLNTDAADTGSDAEGADTWEGLEHLEGEEVDIVADGAVMPVMTVTDGKVTLPRKAKQVEIGLHYETTIKTLTPEISTGEGSAQGSRMRVNEVTLKFLNTIGCHVDGAVVAFRDFGPKMLDQPPQPFTGNHRLETSGWCRGDLSITIQQKQPLPFHLLSVTKRFTTNGG